MKVRFCCDSGANVHSCREVVMDTAEDLLLEDGEWEAMPEEQKQELVNDWANERLSIYWEDIK